MKSGVSTCVHFSAEHFSAKMNTDRILIRADRATSDYLKDSRQTPSAVRQFARFQEPRHMERGCYFLIRLSHIRLNDPIQLAWMVKQMES